MIAYVPEIRRIDLGSPRHVHLIGIGGAGMRAIARVLLAMGHTVSGSDRSPGRHIDRLRDLGARVHIGHESSQVEGADLVARSTAVGDANAEVQAAIAAGVGPYSRAEVLVAITELRRSILVAGTHGKTTTASMLAVLLDRAGFDPSFIIGADIAHFGAGASWRSGEFAVIEADESDGTALVLAGAHGIVTSLDPDHLEHYGSVENLNQAFVAMVEGIAGTTAVCIDDSDAAPLAGLDGVVTYGTATAADYRVGEIQAGSTGASFRVWAGAADLGRVQIGLPGLHNVLNATAALALAIEIGVPAVDGVAALTDFGGVARRFEYRGEVDGIAFIDDYAHLPAEVQAAIAAAVGGDWKRVVVTYQPHRYTRTRDLGASFAASFAGADHLVLTDLYPAGEAPIPGVSGRVVLDAVAAHDPSCGPVWQPTLDDVVDHLVATLRPGDLCLTLGAGDLTTVPDRVIERIGHG